MPAEEQEWHGWVETALADSKLQIPDGYDLRWTPIPPLDNWMVSIHVDGKSWGVLIAANQLDVTDDMVQILELDAGKKLQKIIAIPYQIELSKSIIKAIETADVHLLRFTDK